MKDLLLIILLCILAASKVTIQGFFAKKNVKTLPDAIFFNGIIFLASGLLFLKDSVGCSVTTAIFGAVFGILTVMFQATYIEALSCGNVSLTVMIVNMSMIIPIAVSVIFYNEKLTVFKTVGTALIILALIISVERDGTEKGVSKKWLSLSLVTAVLNGALAVCQKIFGKTEFKSQNKAFVSWAYITAFFVSVFIYMLLKSQKHKKGFKMGQLPLLCGVSAGIVLSVFQFFNTYAVATINSTVLFPSYNGGALILTTLSSVVILKDRLKKKQLLSVAVGLVAIVLLNV